MTTLPLRPMLAVNAPKKLRFPLFASPKLDGVRCLIVDGFVMSRNLKLIPNHHIRSVLSGYHLDGLDGELIVGDATDKDVYRTTSSGVMSEEGVPNFTYCVFDVHLKDTMKLPYKERLACLKRLEKFVSLPAMNIIIVHQVLVHNQEELDQIEEHYLSLGFEGVMLRDPESPYKYGRSTAKEHYLLKLKRFSDSEAVIEGFEPLMHNENAATLGATGYIERSSKQENLVAMDTLGTLHVRDLKTGIAFKIGTGFTAKDRLEIWAKKEQIIGTVVKYKYFDIGNYDAPRFPVWLGPRDPIDC